MSKFWRVKKIVLKTVAKSDFLCIFCTLVRLINSKSTGNCLWLFPLELIWGCTLALSRNGTLLFGCIHQKIRANCQSPLIDRANCLLVSSSMYVPRTLMKEISSKSTTVQLIPWKSQLNPLTHMCQCDREKYSSSFVKGGCDKHLWWLLQISFYFMTSFAFKSWIHNICLGFKGIRRKCHSCIG